MSNDTGLIVGRSKGKWAVCRLNMSTDNESLVSLHDTRAEAIDAAITEMKDGYYEYGIVHVDNADDPVTDLVASDRNAKNSTANPPKEHL